MKRQGFTTVPLLAFNDSINNGKEISLSLQLDLIDVSKVSIISDTSKFWRKKCMRLTTACDLYSRTKGQTLCVIWFVTQIRGNYADIYLRQYGEIRWQLESKGLKIGDMDTFIAATALEEELIVVTGNTEHFSRIEGLKVENWMER